MLALEYFLYINNIFHLFSQSIPCLLPLCVLLPLHWPAGMWGDPIALRMPLEADSHPWFDGSWAAAGALCLLPSLGSEVHPSVLLHWRGATLEICCHLLISHLMFPFDVTDRDICLREPASHCSVSPRPKLLLSLFSGDPFLIILRATSLQYLMVYEAMKLCNNFRIHFCNINCST